MSRNILVAALNWGLGHAARCIPIIKELQQYGYTPVLASDGMALSLLQNEFPELTTIELPSYDIQYSKKGAHLKWKLLRQAPKILKAIKAEQLMTIQLQRDYDFAGIISDNRFGVYSNACPSVFMTHQLQVPSGATTRWTSNLHAQLYRKFDECWVPDHEFEPNLSGALGHQKTKNIPIRYIGPLSRFRPEQLPVTNDLLILLSGPEPQRSLLEERLIELFSEKKTRGILVRGLIETEQQHYTLNQLSVYNYMNTQQLQDCINASNVILARSGYTSIMDLCKLKKKAFFIPTPGQFEQEYLARHLEALQLAPSCTQDAFTLEQMDRVKLYKGMHCLTNTTDFKSLLSLFEGK